MSTTWSLMISSPGSGEQPNSRQQGNSLSWNFSLELLRSEEESR